MVKYEYIRKIEPTIAQCNELGQQGWDNYNVSPTTYLENQRTFFFKRVIE